MKDDIFLQRIAEELAPQVKAPAKVLVALSGGADSVCLLLALKALNYDVLALHCNFELRGLESDGDEAFCRRLCRAKGIALQVKHFRTKSYAERHGVSIEMAARELRYTWFREEMKKQQAVAIAVAHHRDDDAETFFLNLSRGTGIHGLTGMKVLTDDILRPLLCVSRTEIEAWLKEQQQDWVVDSTNLDADATNRNKLRLDILPQLHEMNSNFSHALHETQNHLSEAAALYDDAVARAKAKVLLSNGGISIAKLLETPAPRTVLFELLSPCGFGSAQVKEIFEHLQGESGKLWESNQYRLLRDRGNLLLQPKSDDITMPLQVLPLEGYVNVGKDLHLKISRAFVGKGFVIPKDHKSVCLDLDKLTLPLTIRRVQEGDRMQPFGMTGTRLVSDMLTDAKLSVFEKERQYVVQSGNEIVWLVGFRAAAGYEITDKTSFAMTISNL